MLVGEILNHFGNIPTTVIILVVLGILEMAAGKSGVILIMCAGGNIIKGGVIN